MSKRTETEITRLLNIPYPIIQGPFGRGGSASVILIGIILIMNIANTPGEVSYRTVRVDDLDIFLVHFASFMVATMTALVMGKSVLVGNAIPFLCRFDRAP